MSTLDQPLLIANVNYHVGHQVALAVAEEQGHFRTEGLKSYVYENRGLLPGPFEKEGLALAMKEHGVDIATAVDVEAAIWQAFHAKDVFVVGGWRYTPYLKWYGAKDITDPRKLRGRKIGTREGRDGLVQSFIANALRDAGLDPEKDVEWVYDPVFGYRNNPAHMEMLRSGKVDAITSSPPFSTQLEAEGFPVIVDPNTVFPRRPGKVTVATKRTVEQRPDELRAYFRAIIRAFWFMRDTDNFEYLRNLETRLRKTTHNEDEQRLLIVSAPDRVDSWALPIDGAVERQALQRIIEEMRATEKVNQAIPVSDVLRDGPVTDAYREVSSRPEMQSGFNKARAAVEKYGF